jgi:hypothetical protein
VERAIFYGVMVPLNRLLRYDAFKRGLPVNECFQLQGRPPRALTDSQVRAGSRWSPAAD